METLTAIDFVRGLAGVGATGLAVWILALVGPRIPAFVALTDFWKRVVMFGLSAVIALVAWALVKYVPDAFWLSVQEPFEILMLIGAAIFGNQLVHRVGPKLSRVALQAEKNRVIIDNIPQPTALAQTVADVDRIREAGMIVPDSLLTPSMRGLDLVGAPPTPGGFDGS